MRSAGVSGAAAAAATGDYTLFPRATFLDRLAAVALDIVLVGIAAAFLGFDRFRGPRSVLPLTLRVPPGVLGMEGDNAGRDHLQRAHHSINADAAALHRCRGAGTLGDLFDRRVGIGYFWMLSDPDRQTWHDKIAGTFVVKLPRELVLD
jgi:hypothetical protein